MVLTRRIAWVAACSLVLAACGGGSDDSDSNGAGSGGSGAAAGAGGSSGSGTGGSGAGGSGGDGGSSGAGGSSGSAGTGGDAGASGGSCPPAGPFGNQAGDTAPDATLYDCAGNPVGLHTLCDKDISAIYTFAAWCSVCKSHMNAGDPQGLYTKYQNEDFEMYVVVTQAANGSLPDQTLCENTRDTYSLPMTVLFDKDGVIPSELAVQVNSGDMMFDRGMVIRRKGGYSFGAMKSELEGHFGY